MYFLSVLFFGVLMAVCYFAALLMSIITFIAIVALIGYVRDPKLSIKEKILLGGGLTAVIAWGILLVTTAINLGNKLLP